MHETAYRTHTCGELRASHAGRRVTLSGWVHRRRDQGGLVFLDLRDRFGRTQVSVSQEEHPAAHEAAAATRPEFTIRVEGTVVERPESARNDKLPTGAIEVVADSIRVLTSSPTPPFPIDGSEAVGDEVRLRHRPLDLRTERMRRNLLLRHRMTAYIRAFFEAREFVDVETPILAKASPEGARDYLVPSRIHPGKFFALPQAPQIYKQILMCGGLDRYYQIARCFRDEDLRADRQPEFTQLDVEMSFVEQADVLEPIEELISGLVRKVARHPVALPRPWPRIPYFDALLRYGTDKPDLRFGLDIEDVTDDVAGCGFQVFQARFVRALRVPGGASLSRKQIEAFQEDAAPHGAKGVAWMKVTDDGASGPVAKFFPDGSLAARLEAVAGDLLLFVADDDESVVAWSLGAVRLAAARVLDLVPEHAFAACFVVDFPMFLPDGEGGFVPAHHPFTMPAAEDLDRLESDPGAVRARAYDPVLNGVELGSGSIRIHDPDVQRRVFSAMGIDESTAKEKFGFLLDVLAFGAPPHGGIALGLDRLAMLLAGEDNIREVIAFPKTARAVDLMSDSPSPVEPEQLSELGLSLRDDEGLV